MTEFARDLMVRPHHREASHRTMNDAKTPPMSNESAGNFFEDFKLGQEIVHATPRTVTVGDVSLFTALYGSRFAVQSSDAFAQSIGYPTAPIDDMLTFHIVLGKTVPDISRNAIANLGYADMRFLKPVYPGDTLSTTTEIIGLKENSNRKNGTVYVRSTGRNQRGEPVLSFSRWVMVNKRDESAPAPEPHVPELIAEVEPSRLGDALPSLKLGAYDYALAGSAKRWGDYQIGDKIDHVDGQTIEEAEHQLATRLFQNTARVHFNQHIEAQGRFKRRIVYGGHVISIARALSFNGLANAFHLAAINGGRHVAPSFAGDTIYAWSEITDKAELPGRTYMGALRLRLFAVKDRNCADFPGQKADGAYEDGVVLDLDCWVALPR
jgi:2-methylfumaryl-CoA hydratase